MGSSYKRLAIAGAVIAALTASAAFFGAASSASVAQSSSHMPSMSGRATSGSLAVRGTHLRAPQAPNVVLYDQYDNDSLNGDVFAELRGGFRRVRRRDGRRFHRADRRHVDRQPGRRRGPVLRRGADDQRERELLLRLEWPARQPGCDATEPDGGRLGRLDHDCHPDRRGAHGWPLLGLRPGEHGLQRRRPVVLRGSHRAVERRSGLAEPRRRLRYLPDVGRPPEHVRDRPRCARSDVPPERHHRATSASAASASASAASASASASASATSASAASATSASATSATSASATSATSASATSASAGPVPRPTRARPAARSCEAEDPGKALLGRQGPARSLEALPQGTRHRPVAAARLAPAARLPGQPRGWPRLSHFN